MLDLKVASGTLATFSSSAGSSPQKKRVVVPARHANSHSASVGRRYLLPSFLLSQAQNARASFQLTPTTGWSSLRSVRPVMRQSLFGAVVPLALGLKLENPLPSLSASVGYFVASTNARNWPRVPSVAPRR